MPAAQAAAYNLHIVPRTLFIRTHGALVRDMVPAIAGALQSVLPEVPKANVRPLLDLADEGTRSWRLGARSFSLYAVAAVVMAGVGLFAALALMVPERNTEISVRIALGATPGAVIAVIVRHVGVLLASGCGPDMVLILLIGRFIERLLFEVGPTDPGVLASVMLLLCGVAALNALLPPMRAARLNPTEHCDNKPIALRTMSMTRTICALWLAAIVVIPGTLMHALSPAENQQTVASARRFKVGDERIRELAITSPAPEYPRVSLAKGVAGVIVAAVLFDATGATEAAEIVQSPDAETGRAVRDARLQWKIRPIMGSAGRGTLAFYFRLKKRDGVVLSPEEMRELTNPGATRVKREDEPPVKHITDADFRALSTQSGTWAPPRPTSRLIRLRPRPALHAH